MKPDLLLKTARKLSFLSCFFPFLTPLADADPIPVELVYERGYHLLLRGGEPYFVKGAGGNESIERLASIGGNSVRTWGPPDREFLDRAHELGLSVCVGLWIVHERHGFDYDDDEAVAEQIALHCKAIDELKDHPAVLMWAIGNEVELEYTNSRVWEVVEAVAAHAKKVDPHHPTMTVIAHVDHEVVVEIMKHCPSIDILGSNSYGGIGILKEGIHAAGWTKPYMVTEWGNDGNWEVPKTEWGAEIEPTSTEKALQRAARYAIIAGDRTHSLGSYAFHWGWKQETTPTWFNLFSQDGAATESVAMLQYMWTGVYPDVTVPRVAKLQINGKDPEASLVLCGKREARATYQIIRGDEKKLKVHWELLPESSEKGIGGDPEDLPAPVDLDALVVDKTELVFETPGEPGAYRLYLYLYGEGNTVAEANFPFKVE